jgi:hypothetical protein
MENLAVLGSTQECVPGDCVVQYGLPPAGHDRRRPLAGVQFLSDTSLQLSLLPSYT